MRYDPDELWVIEPEDYAAEAYAETALVVLLAAEVLSPVNGRDAGLCLMVRCNDTFAWGTADVERVPPIGFGDDLDEPFWDLWRRWKEDPTWGPVQWVALRRQQCPMRQVVEKMRLVGAWPAELEALLEGGEDGE